MADLISLTPSERFLHRLAFLSPELQISLADIEDRMFAAEIGREAIERPVFITSLPRAGTTLLLEMLFASGGFSTHTYRSMPYVLCPLLWDSIAKGFRRTPKLQERAHGDGMLISHDSPEAFEEVIWKAFFARKYGPRTIALWTQADAQREFDAFMRSHMRKLCALGRRKTGTAHRYLSKNNANIARIGLLSRMFPDCVIVVPFRNPLAQSQSLLAQHSNFLSLHAQAPFMRRYMTDLGHFEFGAGLAASEFSTMVGCFNGGRRADDRLLARLLDSGVRICPARGDRSRCVL